jgi:hypothetical protein
MLLLMRNESSHSTKGEEKGSMSDTLERVEQAPSLARQAPLLKKGAHIPGTVPETGSVPKVLIKGDIRLRIPESYAALRPVRGHYRIETEGMQEPLQVIWIIEGTVLNHTVHALDVAFDVRGTPAGETLTRLVTAQVTDSNGQGRIVHSSVFVQIFVIRDPALKQTSR